MNAAIRTAVRSASDALFTTTSAVCVTGLIVVDTPMYFIRLSSTILMLLNFNTSSDRNSASGWFGDSCCHSVRVTPFNVLNVR